MLFCIIHTYMLGQNKHANDSSKKLIKNIQTLIELFEGKWSSNPALLHLDL